MGVLAVFFECKLFGFVFFGSDQKAKCFASLFGMLAMMHVMRVDHALQISASLCRSPGIEINQLDEKSKKIIEESIETDFHEGYKGIKQLPASARFGVYVAYAYYLALFKKIRNTPADKILQSRIRICNRDKIRLLAYSFFKHQLNII